MAAERGQPRVPGRSDLGHPGRGVGERLVLDWDDEGEVVFTLEEVPDGTRLLVREVSAEWSTALELRASALAWTPA